MIRLVTELDIPRIAEISVFGWRTSYRGIISDEILFSRISVLKRIEQFKNALLQKTEETYVYDDGLIKGMLTIGKCRDTDKPQTFELWGIYVDPCMQRNGVGSKLMDFCEKEAVLRGYDEIYLWVLEANKKAKEFYESKGYCIEGAKNVVKSLSAIEIRYCKKLK